MILSQDFDFETSYWGNCCNTFKELLDNWIGQKGGSRDYAESGCYGKAYYGCFDV